MAYESLTIQKDDITIRLSQLQEAEDNYYITAKYVLELAHRSYDLFMRSEAQKRRQFPLGRTKTIRFDSECHRS